MDPSKLQPKWIGLTLVILLLAACDMPQLGPTSTPEVSPTSTPKPTPEIIVTEIIEVGPAGTREVLPTCTPKPTPGIIDHPQPTLTVNTDFFEEAGCKPESGGWWSCAGDSQVSELGCEWLYSSDRYGGLEPGYPVAVCKARTELEGGCLRWSGGMIPICESIVAYLDGTLQLVSTQKKLQEMFAPIESADEALSYALLGTQYYAIYDPRDYRLHACGFEDLDPGLYHYFTDALEDTHVVEIENGYTVYLFDESIFGCGPHPVWSAPVQVRHDGTIAELPMTKLFQEEDCTYLACCQD